MRSLRTKITAAFLAPTLIIVLLFGLLTYFASRQGLEDELGRRLISVGQTLSSQLSDVDVEQISRLTQDNGRVIARLKDRLTKAKDTTGVERVFLFNKELKSLVDTQETAFGQVLHAQAADSVELERVFAHAEPRTSVLFAGPEGTLYKTGYAPVMREGEVVAVIGVEASAEFFVLLRNFASVMTFLGLIALLLMMLVSAVVSRRITKPVRALVASADNLGKGDYTTPIPSPAGRWRDEIALLSESFEEMRKEVLSRDRQTQMMLSGIAHEVRNPLGGMKLFVGLLKEDLSDRPDESEKVQKIERELNYLDRVVTDFLDFARHQAPDMERFRAATLLAEIDSLMSAECAGVGARIELACEPEEVELTADRQKLRRAIINCVRNAYQACETSDVTIRIEVKEVGERRHIEIRDNGPGIPEDTLKEILTPFFTTKEKGSGLGLSLTNRIMEEHGGSMTIESEVGSGTTVRFDLPFNAEIEAEEMNIPEGWLG